MTGCLNCAEYGMNGAFSLLSYFSVWNNSGMEGSLPPEWGSSGGMQRLYKFTASGCGINGTLPSLWATQLPALSLLYLDHNQLTGEHTLVACRGVHAAIWVAGQSHMLHS